MGMTKDEFDSVIIDFTMLCYDMCVTGIQTFHL